MLVPQGDGDGGEVEAGGAEATTERRPSSRTGNSKINQKEMWMKP